MKNFGEHPPQTLFGHTQQQLQFLQGEAVLNMAGVADKARFFLERSVPQLREWEEKSIFSKVREGSSQSSLPSLANIQ